MTDRIQFQEFKQISDVEWEYQIISKARAKYRVLYKVLKTGFIREVLITDGKLLMDREFRAGEKLIFTFEDVIAHFGNVSQAMKGLTSLQSQ